MSEIPAKRGHRSRSLIKKKTELVGSDVWSRGADRVEDTGKARKLGRGK